MRYITEANICSCFLTQGNQLSLTSPKWQNTPNSKPQSDCVSLSLSRCFKHGECMCRLLRLCPDIYVIDCAINRLRLITFISFALHFCFLYTCASHIFISLNISSTSALELRQV